ncbi:MAG: hypothetical protein MUC50_20525 [Myxococcota bacterium]|jgi:hypothetical protein|nr:hypothetical protein [Myxococcota bacterium]
MISVETISKVWGWSRDYLIAITLISMLAFSFIKVAVVGVGPAPQGPPQDYELGKTQIELEWSKGNREGEIRVQVSMDDPSFAKPFVDKPTTATTHSLNDLEPGRLYYWRLVQNGRTSRVARFGTASNAVKF